MAVVEIDAADVLRLIMQFLREHNLTRSVAAIQAESNVGLNIVEDIQSLCAETMAGRWDVVLPQISTLKLPITAVIAIYEQVLRELVELGEQEAAKEVLRTVVPLIALKRDDPQRFLGMERMVARAQDVYPLGETKQTMRAEIVKILKSHIEVVPPSRLMVLLSQALQWQQQAGQLPQGARFDIFRGITAAKRDVDELAPSQKAGDIKHSFSAYPASAIVSKDGASLITGSIDGVIELYDPDSGKLRKDLAYQSKDDFMVHDEGVLALALTPDGILLASGDRNGKIKIWKTGTGECIRQLPRVHEGGVCSLAFSRDGGQLLSGGYNGTANIWGMRSGKMLNQFTGHGGPVVIALYLGDGTAVLTASSDGHVRIFDASTAMCMLTAKPPQLSSTAEAPINSVVLFPQRKDLFLVCNRSPNLYVMNQSGETTRTLTAGGGHGDFVCATISPQGRWIYGVTEDKVLHCFTTESGRLESSLPTGHSKDVVGILHHPLQNWVATYSIDGGLSIFKP